jgi:hypothetical protein
VPFHRASIARPGLFIGVRECPLRPRDNIIEIASSTTRPRVPLRPDPIDVGTIRRSRMSSPGVRVGRERLARLMRLAGVEGVVFATRQRTYET